MRQTHLQSLEGWQVRSAYAYNKFNVRSTHSFVFSLIFMAVYALRSTTMYNHSQHTHTHDAVRNWIWTYLIGKCAYLRRNTFSWRTNCNSRRSSSSLKSQTKGSVIDVCFSTMNFYRIDKINRQNEGE